MRCFPDTPLNEASAEARMSEILRASYEFRDSIRVSMLLVCVTNRDAIDGSRKAIAESYLLLSEMEKLGY